MAPLKVAYIQTGLIWENPQGNRLQLETYLNDLTGVDLVVLPEMFTTGFSMDAANLSENMEGETIWWMKKIASQKGFGIMGSLIIRDKGCFYNRMVLVTPAQEIQIYDKHHLFTMGNEPETYTAGASPVTFEYRGWVIKPAVCYDLRFPVWLRNNNQYHVMICVANWPAARSDAFTTLLKARAIENQCYVIGVNRVGVDGNGLEYSGDSCILGPKGEIIESSLPGAIECKIAELSINKLNDFRVKFPVLNDADRFEIKT